MLSPDVQQLLSMISRVKYNGSQHTNIIIEEKDSSAQLKKIKLNAPNGNWFVFDPDEGRKCHYLKPKSNLVIMSPLLKIGDFDHHKACDAVIVIKRNEELTILYIDLKSGNPQGYSGQFKSTRQFVRYALGLLEEFYNEKLTISNERYFIFYGGKPKISMKKKSFTPEFKNLKSSKPDEACKLEVSNNEILYLKALLA